MLLHTHDEHVVFCCQSHTVFRVTAVERALNSAFLGTLAKLRKTTISYVMSVRPSVRVEQLGSHWTDFRDYISILRKSVEKIQVLLKSYQTNGF
jgi:hypothetical protein